LKIFSLDVAQTTLNFAVVNGLGEVKTLLDSMGDDKPKLHFIEVMTCPGGCAGGGGQPYQTNIDGVKKRSQRMYDVDNKSESRLSHENEQVKELYAKVLEKPGSHVSHKLLHRHYIDRKKAERLSAVK